MFNVSFKCVLGVFKVGFNYVSGVFKVSFKSVSRVLKGSFINVSIVFVFIEVIAATRAYGGLVSSEQAGAELGSTQLVLV